MADTTNRYRRLAAALSETVAAVPADAWDRPSPCEEWTAAAVIAHVAATEWEHLERMDLQPDGSPPDDPLAAWSFVRDAVQAVLDDPDRAETPHDGWFGPTTFAATIDQFYAPDLVVHRWDIARATGLADHEAMPADEIETIHTGMAAMGDAARLPGVFGPEVPVPDDADPQTKLLGFLGRQP